MPPQDGPYAEDSGGWRGPGPSQDDYSEHAPRPPHEPSADTRPIFEPHPMFTPVDADGKERRQIVKITIMRRSPAGRPVHGGRTWRAEDLRWWDQIQREWGGGPYKAIGHGPGGQVVAYSPPDTNDWMELDGPSRPMVDRGESEAAAAAVAPAPAAAAPAGPAASLPPELTQVLNGLAKGIETLVSVSQQTTARLDRLEDDVRRKPEETGQGVLATVIQTVMTSQQQAAERSDKLLMALLTKEPPAPPPAVQPPDPLAMLDRAVTLVRNSQPVAPPAPPPAAPQDPVAGFLAMAQAMRAAQEALGGGAGQTNSVDKLVDAGTALATKVFDADLRDRQEKAETERARIAAEKEIAVARALALAPGPLAPAPQAFVPTAPAPPTAVAPPAAVAQSVPVPPPVAMQAAPPAGVASPSVVAAVEEAASPPAPSGATSGAAVAAAPAAPPPAASVPAESAPPVATPPSSVVVDLSDLKEIPTEVRNFLADAMKGVQWKDTAKVMVLLKQVKGLPRQTRAKFLSQVVSGLSHAQYGDLADAMQEMEEGMLLTLLPSLVTTLGGTKTHLNGSNQIHAGG